MYLDLKEIEHAHNMTRYKEAEEDEFLCVDAVIDINKYRRLNNVTTWTLRFINNLMNKNNRNIYKTLNADEVNTALV